MKPSILIIAFLLVTLSGYAQQQLYFDPIYVPHTDTTLVFTPKDYGVATTKKYPLIYLLHGCGANYRQWNSIISVQKYADAYGFIIVCPDGLKDSWYINSPRRVMSKFEDFFFQDLFPAIKTKYRIDEEMVFITGICSGGHGAFNLFSKKPELFRSAGSSGGVLDLTVEASNKSLQNIIGSDESEIIRKFSMINNLGKIAAAQKEIIFDCGTEDINYEANNDFRKRCDELKVKATYISQPGKHDKAYWQRAIKTQFDFFKRIARE
jgi:S-formylglutathione hydrolase FrmB